MSDFPEGTDWWKASDGRWYAPPATLARDPPEVAPTPPAEEREAERVEAQQTAGRGCLIGVAVVVALIVAFSLTGGGDSDDDPNSSDRSSSDLDQGAFEVCTQFVKDRLRAPGTASFPNQFEDDGEVVITGGPDVYTVRSHVDAENGFGGEVRGAFVCQVRHVEGENWTLVDLTM